MVRGMHTRKRSRPSQGGRAFKRKRRTFHRKKNLVRASGSGSTNIQYRSKKLSRRAYRRILWNTTIPLTHYRSSNTIVNSLNTPASFTSGTSGSFYADEDGSGNSFITTAGGLNSADLSVVPVFTGQNIILRGGQMNCTLYNNVEDGTLHGDLIHYQICLLSLSNQFDKTTFDALTPGTFGLPDEAADFRERFGTILLYKKGILKQEESVSIAYRDHVRKIDWHSYNISKKGSSKRLWWITIHNGFGNVAQNCRFRTGYSFSFVGDVTA